MWRRLARWLARSEIEKLEITLEDMLAIAHNMPFLLRAERERVAEAEALLER